MPPSPIHPFAWQNDGLVPIDDVHLSPFQTGLLTGWGLFTTLRIYRGVPFALEYHWERLSTDGIKLHVSLDGLEPKVRAGLAELIARNQAREAVARVYMIRNHGGLLDRPAPRPTDLLMFTRELRAWGPSSSLRLQAHGRHAQSPLAGTKTLTWAHNLVLVEQANALGFDDVLLLNERGEIAECTAANIFLVRDGLLYTPPLESGALAGISRRVLLEAAPRHGLKVIETTLRPPDLFRAAEVFITSSTREVQPVTRIDDRPIPTGPLTEKVAALFKQEVDRYTAAHTPAEASATR